jgi:hypothetical protein
MTPPGFQVKTEALIAAAFGGKLKVATCAERHPAEDLYNASVLDETREAGAS